MYTISRPVRPTRYYFVFSVHWSAFWRVFEMFLNNIKIILSDGNSLIVCIRLSWIWLNIKHDLPIIEHTTQLLISEKKNGPIYN